MTNRERIRTRYPDAVCIRHRSGDGLTHYSVYHEDPLEWPDVICLGTGWTEHAAWEDAVRREFPQYAREERRL
jgi:hypothetical protein